MVKLRSGRPRLSRPPHRPSTADRAIKEPPAAGLDIGVRLRHARMTRGLRLRDLADRVGCSESLLSKIENGRAMPSLHMLHRILGAVGLTMGQLFGKANEPAGIVSRAGERPVVALDRTGGGNGIQLEQLIPYDQSHLLQGSIHIIEPGGGSDGPLTHEGEEAGYVIDGTIELTVGDAAHILHPGDSFCFRSERPHAYRNAGDRPARVIVVNTPPTF